MVRKCMYFLKILKAELEDLLEDLQAVEERYRERFAGAEITNYVLLENEALLSREFESIQALILRIDGMNSSQYKSVNEIVEDLDAVAREFIHSKEYPAAVHRLLRRKMDKVYSYVMAEDAP